jgi:hypothetical protein
MTAPTANFRAHVLNRCAILRSMSGAQVVALTDAELREIAAEHEALIDIERNIVDLRRLLRRVGLR